MDIIKEIGDFFARLFRQKVNAMESTAKAKVAGAQVRAQSKVSNSINKKINQGANAVKQKAQSTVQKKK
jgi:gas vesicle protein